MKRKQHTRGCSLTERGVAAAAAATEGGACEEEAEREESKICRVN